MAPIIFTLQRVDTLATSDADPPPPIPRTACGTRFLTHQMFGFRFFTSVLGWGVIALGLIGCASDPAPVALDQRDAAGSPAVIGSLNGLEVRWWVAAGRDGEIGSILRRYESTPVPIDPAMRASWRGNGLRILGVPLDELDGLRDELRMAASVQRQWLGQVPFWTELVSGARHPVGQVIALDTERVGLSPGKLRLLTRAWTASVSGPAGPESRLRVELVPQNHESRSRTDPETMLGLRAPASNPIEQGLTFERLMVSAEASQGVALMIVPEGPGVDWSVLEPESPEPPMAEPPESGLGRVFRADRPKRVGRMPGAASEAAATAASAEAFGPVSASLPTLGEAMLRTRRSNASSPDVRALVVLIPRVPERFSLFRK